MLIYHPHTLFDDMSIQEFYPFSNFLIIENSKKQNELIERLDLLPEAESGRRENWMKVVKTYKLPVIR